MTTNQNPNNNFDFMAFSKLTGNKPAGLQIFLAQQLLTSALWQMDRWDNPRADDLRGIVMEMKALRADLKQDAADRAKRSENNATG